MNWKIKNAMFYLFEGVPFGDKLYYLMQKYITKSVWVDDSHFRCYFETKVKNHLEVIRKYGNRRIDESVFFEFGAGWDMLAPIGFGIGGGQRYIAVDLNDYAHPELVKNTMELYSRNRDFIEKYYDSDVFSTQYARIDDIDGTLELIKELFHIEYYAPMDAGNTPFNSASIDYVISNVSLEHIPYEDVRRIFKECYRLLKADGILSVTVDYSDHWQHTDNRISVFNYMKYSEKRWKKYNPSIHYQNRLRQSDYLRLLKESGFEIIQQIPSYREDEREILKGIEIDEYFKKYSFEELLLRDEHFIAKKCKG